MRRPPRELIYPGWADPRWLQLCFLFSYVVYALSSPCFSRSPAQFAAGAAACLGVDAALIFFYRGLLLVPFSGLISACGLLLLCDSPDVWPYAAIGALSMLSKHFIRVGGRHIFNPTAFGLVFGLFFFSGEMNVVAGRWGGSPAGMAAVACLGALTVWRANRLDLAAAYVLTFAVGVLARSALTGANPMSVAGPMTGAAFQLFTFFMITDPMTTPETRAGRLVFGVALGVLESALRLAQISYAPFFALFVLDGFVPFFREAFRPPEPERVWRPVSRAL
ncbi:MAG: RnfABCDGE type electron transport complex subunit D [Elusimicrobia bacterium]|nr:RnfABCDGE type electron transport complex subunit D [Elusimicrobiota bacterium]